MRKQPHGLSKRAMKAINECDSGDESNYEVAGMGSDQENEFPEACMICEGNFTEPVVTKCRHYFCEGCALRNYATDSNCFGCG
mmetsp:Transcript_12867/g.17310  ORF Transcript_12867/g.17310 Transcript_12867/m.17310 type:complete len:83 (-) Transcript_12867:222-470(-)